MSCLSREESQLLDRIKKGEERTVQQYQTVKISEEAITQLCSQIRSLLNQANRRGRLSKEILKQLQQAGQSLYDQLLSREAKERLEQSQAEHLVLRIDDQLVQIPWELLYDGKEFLCLRFNMGRIVSTRQRVREGKARKIARPLRMLVLADPRGDLPQSAREGILLRDELDRYSDLITVNLKSSRIDRNYILSRIRDYDIVHYAGHADYDSQSPEDSGWLLADGKLKALEIKNLSGRKPMPALVFANGCQSGQTEAWSIESNYEERIFGLANAFLVSGVQHYIGTFWEILDEPGREFALAFYQELLAGATIGEAIKEARKHLLNKYGEETIVWASYMLYGDPSYSYLVLAKEEEKEEPEEVKEPAPAFAETALRGSTAETLAVKKFPASRWVYLGILLAFLIAGGLWLFRSGIQVKIPEDEIELAYQQLRQGNLASAQEKFTKFAEKRGLVQARGLEGLSAVFFGFLLLASCVYYEVVPAQDSLAVGETVRVDIYLHHCRHFNLFGKKVYRCKDTSDVYGAGFDLYYDSTLLSYQQTDLSNSVLSGATAAVGFRNSSTENGKLVVGVSRQGQVAGEPGEGIIATIIFRANNSGTTELTLDDPYLVDSQGNFYVGWPLYWIGLRGASITINP